MLVEIVKSYPCETYDCWDLELRKNCTFYWVDFRVLLVTEITEYNCSWSRNTLIHITEHKEEGY